MESQRLNLLGIPRLTSRLVLASVQTTRCRLAGFARLSSVLASCTLRLARPDG